MSSQPPGTPDNLRDRLNQALRRAIKVRDAASAAALRSALAAIGNAEAVDTAARPAGSGSGSGGDAAIGSAEVAGAVAGVGTAEVARRYLTDAEVVGIVEREIADRVVAAGEYDSLGRADRAERLRLEAEALAAVLP